jgi:hypothetical protein
MLIFGPVLWGHKWLVCCGIWNFLFRRDWVAATAYFASWRSKNEKTKKNSLMRNTPAVWRKYTTFLLIGSTAV